MIGFKFNNKHSYNDFELLLESKKILPPAKKKIKLDVPFLNGSYDFSTIATNGEQIFNERKIDVVFGFTARSKKQLYVLYSNILEWLMDTEQQQLIFDDISDYYFMVDVEGISEFEEIVIYGKLKVTFIAEPFKIGIDFEGNKKWDTFNFEVDVLQDVSFDIVGGADVSIYNVGRIVMPTVIADSNFTLTFNSKTYNVVAGNNTFYDFKLQNGANNINIVGTGNIKFLFRKQVI